MKKLWPDEKGAVLVMVLIVGLALLTIGVTSVVMHATDSGTVDAVGERMQVLPL